MSDGPSALLNMARFHWSILNSQYNTTVINSWRTSGHYDEIRRRLGYRFSLIEASWTPEVAPGGSMNLHVRLRNGGFASLFNPRKVRVVLSNGVLSFTAALDLEPRRWKPGQESEFAVRLQVPASVPAGLYRLSLSMADEAANLRSIPEYAIRFANQGVWDGATGRNLLTDRFEIDPTAPGAVDLSATEFRQIP